MQVQTSMTTNQNNCLFSSQSTSTVISIHHMPQIAKLFQIQISCTKKPNGLWSVSFHLFHTYAAYIMWWTSTINDYILFFSMLDFLVPSFSGTQLNSGTDFFQYCMLIRSKPICNQFFLRFYCCWIIFLQSLCLQQTFDTADGIRFQFIWLSFELFCCCCCYCFR